MPPPPNATAGSPPPVRVLAQPQSRRGGLFGILGGGEPAAAEVNAYLWAAALDVLGFLPMQSVDPHSGLIVTGFGTAPGGSRAYRATVLIKGAELEATSLVLTLHTRTGPASPQTVAAVSDAIFARARQLRLAQR